MSFFTATSRFKPPSEADSGPWVHGNVVTALPRAVDRERSGTPTQRGSYVSEADTTSSWRLGEVVTVHKDASQVLTAVDLSRVPGRLTVSSPKS